MVPAVRGADGAAWRVVVGVLEDEVAPRAVDEPDNMSETRCMLSVRPAAAPPGRTRSSGSRHGRKPRPYVTAQPVAERFLCPYLARLPVLLLTRFPVLQLEVLVLLLPSQSEQCSVQTKLKLKHEIYHENVKVINYIILLN